MTKKSKARTKPEMKKSIDNLYKALQKEKARHQKASDLIAKIKPVLGSLAAQNHQQHMDIADYKERIADLEHQHDISIATSAAIIKNIAP